MSMIPIIILNYIKQIVQAPLQDAYKYLRMKKYIFLLATIIFSIIGITSCVEDDIKASSEDNLKKGQEYLEANAKREGVITTPTGLQYEVLVPGREDGKTPNYTNSVRCHYKGTFIDGTIFDTTYKSGNPIVFPLSGVIPGWTEGLQYMKEGAKYRFVIPYQLAYGPNGYATIPPYSTLIFEVELIEVL